MSSLLLRESYYQHLNKSFQLEAIFFLNRIELIIFWSFHINCLCNLRLYHPDKNLVGEIKLNHDFIKLIQQAYEINAKQDVLHISYGTYTIYQHGSLPCRYALLCRDLCAYPPSTVRSYWYAKESIDIALQPDSLVSSSSPALTSCFCWRIQFGCFCYLKLHAPRIHFDYLDRAGHICPAHSCILGRRRRLFHVIWCTIFYIASHHVRSFNSAFCILIEQCPLSFPAASGVIFDLWSVG